MKNWIFGLLLIMSIGVMGQGAVTIAATNGGSVSLTPEGVFKNEPKMQMAKPKAKAVSTKDVKMKAAAPDDGMDAYALTDIGIDEARLIRNNLASTAYEETPNANDWKAFLDLRAFIVANKDFKNSSKKLNITVSAAMLERIMSSSNYYGWSGINSSAAEIQKQYDESMKSLNLRKKIVQQGEDLEKKNKVPKDKSKVEQFKRFIRES